MKAPEPGAHGGDGARLAARLGVPVEEVLDLSASLNPVAPDPLHVVSRHLGAIARYPDPAAAEEALAAAVGVDRGLIVVTNGGSEAVALVAAELGRGWVEQPEFSLYERHLRETVPGAPLWRSNPNNPTGRLAGPTETAAVWDEAFWQLATGTWTRGDHRKGSFVLGSLTKLLACPGLRVGYVICPDEVAAERVRQRRPQWSLNGIAASALPELIETVDLPGWRREIASLRAELELLLRSAGLDPEPSDANWLLVEAPGLRDRLAEHAIAVRDCTSFGMPQTVRIAVPGPAGLERLRLAVRQAA